MKKRVDRICSFLMACLLLIHISCTENNSVEDPRQELPENIQNSLQELYPDEIPQSTEQLIDPNTSEVCYFDYMVLLLVWKTKDGWLTVQRIRNYWERKWNITPVCNRMSICRVRFISL